MRMATSTTTPTSAPLRCSFHHRDTADCPPLDPELGDLLPDLAARGVNIRITPTVRFLDPCSGCDEARTRPPGESVAVVAHRAPSEALPDGFIYLEPVCAGCLGAAVTWELRRGAPVWVEIPTAADSLPAAVEPEQASDGDDVCGVCTKPYSEHCNQCYCCPGTHDENCGW